MSSLPLDGDRIDFISAYCDRWCERCAFTARCSVYACQVAEGMCGDLVQGLELAIGRPRQDGPSPPPAHDDDDEDEEEAEDAEDLEPTAEDLAEHRSRDAARRARLDATAITAMSWDYTLGAHRWLSTNRERLRDLADPVLSEALAVVGHDSALIGAKLHRAQSSRDRARHDGDGEDDPHRSDGNGSAKVALISLERSEAAWRAIGQAAVDDDTPAALADRCRDLRGLVVEEFPDAMSFVRPGFDEPWR